MNMAQNGHIKIGFWVCLLVALLGEKDAPEVIARKGWTTGDLLDALTANPPSKPVYHVVTLLIGVNNQFQGRPIAEYRTQFTELLRRCIHWEGDGSLDGKAREGVAVRRAKAPRLADAQGGRDLQTPKAVAACAYTFTTSIGIFNPCLTELIVSPWIKSCNPLCLCAPIISISD